MSLILEEPGKQVLLMGNEAIARGAVEAGIQLMAAYPGTPSSEIGEVLLEASGESDFYTEWSTNEKVAFEVAAGASFVGARTMVAMKNAGLNVAMDTFMTVPYGGVKGGMVVVVADDPDAHYSSNEQDTRALAAYAEIPCLEPCCQQEAKDMARAAFEISEAVELPVFLRSVSRISHASGDVTLGVPEEKRNNIAFNKHYGMPYRWNVYGPPGAVHKHEWLHEQLPKAKALANESPFNHLELAEGAKVGVLATGLAASYTREAMGRLDLNGKASLLKLGFIYPLPDALVEQLLRSGIEELVIVEEGDTVVETAVRSLAKEIAPNVKICGKTYNPVLSCCGEINTDLVTAALAGVFGKTVAADPKAAEREDGQALVAPRSSTLCAGCSHLGTYSAVRECLSKIEGVHIVNGDIGCYEQGGYGIFSAGIKGTREDSKAYIPDSPYDVLDTIYVMGSGISMAHGQSKVGYKDGKLLSVAGDSTFIHATLPALVNAVYNNSDITFLILDNRWTCMTGHQPNPNTYLHGPCAEPQEEAFDIQGVVTAMGVKSLSTVDAYDREAMVDAIDAALAFEGPSVVVVTGECQLQKQRRVKKTMAKTHVRTDDCDGCRSCVQLGCPAIRFDVHAKKSGIDPVLCVDCGLCAQVCPSKAIRMRRR